MNDKNSEKFHTDEDVGPLIKKKEEEPKESKKVFNEELGVFVDEDEYTKE